MTKKLSPSQRDLYSFQVVPAAFDILTLYFVISAPLIEEGGFQVISTN